MEYLKQNPNLLLALVFAIGTCVGSFLNVLALRLLAEKSIWHPPSSCPNCDKRIHFLDLIPVVSYFILQGKCRHCKEKIHWHYPVVELATGVVYAVLVQHFVIGSNFESIPQALAMIFFASVLIAVCITDFKEKLIPHELTYPSITLGILDAALRRTDPLSANIGANLMGTLAGIGASYILFDFLAFYGLKVYLATHRDYEEGDEEGHVDDEVEETAPWWKKKPQAHPASPHEQHNQSGVVFAGGGGSQEDQSAAAESTEALPEEAEASGSTAKTSSNSGSSQSPSPPAPQPSDNDDLDIDDVIDANMDFRSHSSLPPGQAAKDEEEIEVMGGGDAVLAALIAAWLGWKSLVIALFIGFIVGALMGTAYLISEMYRRKSLADCLGPCIKYGAIGVVFMLIVLGALAAMLNSMSGSGMTVSVSGGGLPWAQVCALGAIVGIICGFIKTGSKYSKPFPFGPALAIGAFAAMFIPTTTLDNTFNPPSELDRLGGSIQHETVISSKGDLNQPVLHDQ